MPTKGDRTEGESEAKKPKKHLHQVVTTAVHDGKKTVGYTHHHVYKAKPDDEMTEGGGRMMGMSNDAEEAGQHVADQFGQQEGAGGGGAAAAGGAPEGGAGGGAEPEE